MIYPPIDVAGATLVPRGTLNNHAIPAHLVERDEVIWAIVPEADQVAHTFRSMSIPATVPIGFPFLL